MASKKTFDINRKPLEEPDELGDVLDEIHASPRTKKRAGDTMSTVVIVVVAFVCAIVISNAYISRTRSSGTRAPADSSSAKTSSTNTPATTESAQPTADSSKADPFAPFTLKDAAEVTPTSTQTTPTPTAVPEKNSFTIRILNGNGVTGDAAKLKKELTDKGFTVGDTGNAKLKYTKTQVYYTAQKKAQADLVVQNLSGRTIEESEADAGLIGAGNDVLIVVGKS